MRMHFYMIYVKMENQHYMILDNEDIFTKFTGHPMNWTNVGRPMREKRVCKQNEGSGLF